MDQEPPRKTPLDDVRGAAAGLLGAPDLQVLEPIREGLRTDLWRMTDGDRTVVVKAYHDPQAGTWCREAAGLTAADGLGSPRMLGVNPDPAVVVMSDLGTGSNLADLLLGTDRAAAEAGLRRWARSIGRMHVHGAKGRDRFDRQLTDLGHAGPDEPDALVSRRGMAQLARVTAEQDLPRFGQLQDRIAAVAAPLDDPDAWLLTPGDACPDNNLDTGQDLFLLDYEFAEYRHPAWDLAYLRVPWPSCWCAWELPGEVADRAVAAYRELVAPDLAWAREEDGFEDLVERASVMFCLIAAGWFLPRALREPDPAEGTVPGPGRRRMILNRLALVAACRLDPAVADYARQLRAGLVDRWGEHCLPLAPAFG